MKFAGYFIFHVLSILFGNQKPCYSFWVSTFWWSEFSITFASRWTKPPSAIMRESTRTSSREARGDALGEFGRNLSAGSSPSRWGMSPQAMVKGVVTKHGKRVWVTYWFHCWSKSSFNVNMNVIKFQTVF